MNTYKRGGGPLIFDWLIARTWMFAQIYIVFQYAFIRVYHRMLCECCVYINMLCGKEKVTDDW